MRCLALAAAAVYACAAQAQTVTLNGSMADRAALLIIDGQPRTLAVGATHGGVKVVSVKDGEAVVEMGGRRATLLIGAAPVSVGSGAGSMRGGSEIVLTAGPGGHFVAGGSINGKAVRFLVDTGATSIAISQAEADSIGLQYRHGQRGLTSTANGMVPVHRVVLSSVRVGDVEVYQVEAVVIPAAMDHVLLGNSFLTRFQMKRENDVLRLEKRP
jgi:aspartyl protease family protein